MMKHTALLQKKGVYVVQEKGYHHVSRREDTTFASNRDAKKSNRLVGGKTKPTEEEDSANSVLNTRWLEWSTFDNPQQGEKRVSIMVAL
mmetsp:Transcript_51847/g.75871  ORF Transcript_51847/g.75871 Transcript_51847/m.75871 type:complete len:89 (+) Transcript_51847:110-376(+)